MNLSADVYAQLQRRAEQAQRSVEEEIAVLVATAVPVADGLPPDLIEAIAPLVLLEDADLWKAARSHFSSEAADELEELHFKRQRESWAEDEAQRAATLVREYERALLVRAQAALLLKKRGYDIASLISPS